jgi:3-deoxy-manno-octulosonate cytidylyltransferase (CMP-KDO synthetase)
MLNSGSLVDFPLTVVAVIPARLASSRLPRKVLLPLAGKPMLAWVVEAARACSRLQQVIVATDSEEVMALGRAQGWTMKLTSPDLPSGSDRVHAISLEVDADIYVNIQGDEPMLRPEHIDALLRPFQGPHPGNVDVTTLSTICAPADIANPNAVKVVCAHDGRALYFSRATIPYDRDGAQEGPGSIIYRKHLGLYAYRKTALQKFAALPPGTLEQSERLEQLRLLENGMSVYVEPTDFETIGVDTEEDLRRAEAILLTRR